jgi:hypothetical protein
MKPFTCDFFRLDLDAAKAGLYPVSVLCTEPSVHCEFCLINIKNGICPCEKELIL